MSIQLPFAACSADNAIAVPRHFVALSGSSAHLRPLEWFLQLSQIVSMGGKVWQNAKK
jgi:hypothetical protein